MSKKLLTAENAKKGHTDRKETTGEDDVSSYGSSDQDFFMATDLHGY
jgi:hypothetical protein